MHGDLRLLASNQYMTALKQYPNVCGSGLFMEAIEQNPVYYDLAFEMPLHKGEVAIEEWLKQYANRDVMGLFSLGSASYDLFIGGTLSSRYKWYRTKFYHCRTSCS